MKHVSEAGEVDYPVDVLEGRLDSCDVTQLCDEELGGARNIQSR
jgi:hypothetical protein